MAYIWKNVLLESASMFVGNITASHTIFSGNVTAQMGFLGTASLSTSASYSNTAETASHVLASSPTSSYSDFAESSSYISGTIVVPGIDREILINDESYVGRSDNFQYTSENALILNISSSNSATSSEPPVVEGGMYIDPLFARLRICVTSSTLYYAIGTTTTTTTPPPYDAISCSMSGSDATIDATDNFECYPTGYSIDIFAGGSGWNTGSGEKWTLTNYTLFIYDTFNEYPSGSTPTTGGFYWGDGGWNFTTQSIYIYDTFNEYPSGSTPTTGGINWIGDWTFTDIIV